MNSFLLSCFFLLLIVLFGSCSKEDPPPPFVPEVGCRIASLTTPNPNHFSFEFFYDANHHLSGMCMETPTITWPLNYSFRYAGEQLTWIILTLENDFPDFDSTVTQILYDDRDRPVKTIANTYLDGRSILVRTELVDYGELKFSLKREGWEEGPFDIFYQDDAGNVVIEEVYNFNGSLIRVMERTFDNHPSPFRSFPAALRIHFNGQFNGAWATNVTRSRFVWFSEDVLEIEEFKYSYNSEGYPVSAFLLDGTEEYRYEYFNCP